MIPKWLIWARELQAIAQNGLTFCQNQFDEERYNSIRKIAAEIMSAHTSVDSEIIEHLFSQEKGYATPKIDVRGVVFRDNKILLVKEILDGGWTLPGGWADPNETPSQSVEREVFEESGFRVKANKLLALYDRDKQGHLPPYPFHVFKAFFYCEIVGGIETVSNETNGVDFYNLNEIQDLTLSTGRITLNQLKRFFAENETDDWQTEFD
ncbi:MAG: NUDIX hydrolase N-terminal domain-containing protein [Ignavibacteriales bacterium]|nr:NUDIX hydrolase N-terminal domain-containing protein [Ignavibacteriales bacterium]